MEQLLLSYTLSKNGELKFAPEIVVAGLENCESGHSFGPATRDYYLIHYVLDGEGIFQRGGKEYKVAKNQAFIIRPDEVTLYKADKVNPWKYAWIGFNGDGVGEIVEKATGDGVVMDYSSATASEMESAMNGYGDNPFALAVNLLSLLYKTLGEFYGSINKIVDKPDIVKTSVRYIENNYNQPFDVTVLARELGVSRSYFTTLFTSVMKCSPYKYLLNYRIEKAQKLLAERTNLSVTEIAYSVGFSSVERFSETFSKSVGLSPLAYRKSKLK